MRFLKIESATPPEECFNLPSFRIFRSAPVAIQNQILALRQAHHADRQDPKLAACASSEFRPHCLFDAQLLERHAVCQMAFLEPQTKVQLVFKQIRNISRISEFAVAEDLSDSLCAEPLDCFAQRDDVFFAAHNVTRINRQPRCHTLQNLIQPCRISIPSDQSPNRVCRSRRASPTETVQIPKCATEMISETAESVCNSTQA